MNRISRRAARLLAAGTFAAAILAGTATAASAAQATELTPQCSGGCVQSFPDGFQVSSAAAEPVAITPLCGGGCIQSAPDGLSLPAELTPMGNYEPN
ncbi:hypothetical protein QQY66_45005 [Streptomyces sp. DG2A-72]|uniref:hypothetical protein n=1 Tax=Streptomyces sp. DG2A-72 TaxID=3051386 RepID=UPI00265BB39D|nr:hypothetical protein [Streptomyces sp. DG2A-72]MDO0938540.1 hypothetical protein [Streptomyces sp. DG2A-72]